MGAAGEQFLWIRTRVGKSVWKQEILLFMLAVIIALSAIVWAILKPNSLQHI